MTPEEAQGFCEEDESPEVIELLWKQGKRTIVFGRYPRIEKFRKLARQMRRWRR